MELHVQVNSGLKKNHRTKNKSPFLSVNVSKKVLIGHFQVPPGLCFKTRVGAQPLIWKSFFILMQIKLIFTRKVGHLASFWKWGFWNSEVAYWGLVRPRKSNHDLPLCRQGLAYWDTPATVITNNMQMSKLSISVFFHSVKRVWNSRLLKVVCLTAIITLGKAASYPLAQLVNVDRSRGFYANENRKCLCF